MKNRKNLKPALWHTLSNALALTLLLLGIAQTAQAAPPTPMKIGQTVNPTIEANSSKDYSISLGKGVYRIVWDAERVDGEPSNIIAKLQLLKPNGVIIDSSILGFNDIGVTSRVGMTYRSAKPFVARFRLRTDSAPLKMWLTVVPVAQTTRVPFGWGAKVSPARISSDNGVGGTLEPNASVFHSITLPAGKWSISLGLQLPEGESSNLMGSIDRLDTQGFTITDSLVRLNEIDNQARQEGIVSVLKPTTMLLRVNNGGNKTYTYDVTIEKAS